MTVERLKNIALYYLQRFDSSSENLRQVLLRRIKKYARNNPDFNQQEAFEWVENIIASFFRVGYLDDTRFAEAKIIEYLNMGKSTRYIKLKMKEKGVDEKTVNMILSISKIDEETAAINFIRKKKIGPFRLNEQQRKLYRQKDLATIIRAGFDYELAKHIVDMKMFDENV